MLKRQLVLSAILAILAMAAGRSGAVFGQASAPGVAKAQPAAESLPKEWVDPATGHKVIRISTENGSTSVYFHYNSYSKDGRWMAFTSPSGLEAVDLKTFAVKMLVPTPARPAAASAPATRAGGRGAGGFGGRGGLSLMETGRTTNELFYSVGNMVKAVDFDTGVSRDVVAMPAGHRVDCINADETLFGGTVTEDDPTGAVKAPPPAKILPQRERMFPGKAVLTPDEEHAVEKEDNLARRLANPRCMALFTLNAKTGEVKTFGYQYAWLDHLQFSPTDPMALMFAHEGSWHEVQRPWMIEADGSGLKLMHERTMDMEISGHEFWGKDGKWVWFDLQTPRSQVFWIGGRNVETGEEVKYHVDQNAWGVHYNVSHDGKMFSSDGGDPTQVAFAKDGQWMNLFRVQGDGTLSREKLVDLSKHDYLGRDGEPNGTFTPDDKYVVFRSNMLGAMHVYAVEVAKTQ